MDPRKVLADVRIPEEDRLPRPTSPATDLARLRWRRKRNFSHERFERIVNMKWRGLYTDTYYKEQGLV